MRGSTGMERNLGRISALWVPTAGSPAFALTVPIMERHNSIGTYKFP